MLYERCRVLVSWAAIVVLVIIIVVVKVVRGSGDVVFIEML